MKSKSPLRAKSPSKTISRDLSDQLYIKIIQKISIEKRYLDPNYSAKQLAEDVQSNPRYISVVVASHTGGNYNSLVNSYRLRDARKMLRSPRYSKYTIEEIGLMCGFSSRQSFYLAFHREQSVTPRQYRLHNVRNSASGKKTTHERKPRRKSSSTPAAHSEQPI